MSTLLVAGCASTAGFNQGNITAAKIQSTSDQIAALPGQLDKTLASLNNLVSQPQADLRPQYKEFTANVAAVQSAAKDIATARTKIAADQTEFFAKWDQEIAQIQNQDIKALSQKRRDEVARNLTAIKTSYAQTDMAFKPFMADLSDVQKYLSVDLTPGGIAAIKGPGGQSQPGRRAAESLPRQSGRRFQDARHLHVFRHTTAGSPEMNKPFDGETRGRLNTN